MHYFGFTWDYVLNEISWDNVNMLLASIPVPDYDFDKEETKKDEAVIEVDSVEELAKAMNW